MIGVNEIGVNEVGDIQMNNSNLARRLSTLFVLFFTLVLVITTCYAVDTNLKVGKYRVGVNYSPLSACAVWIATGEIKYTYRAVNAAEYLSVSSKVSGMAVDNAIINIEKIAITRKLTEQETAFCIEVTKLDATVLKAVPSKNGTRPTRDITATTYTKTRVADTSLCEGAIIKKYQTNKNWHKVKDLNLTTLCGKY